MVANVAYLCVPYDASFGSCIVLIVLREPMVDCVLGATTCRLCSVHLALNHNRISCDATFGSSILFLVLNEIEECCVLYV